MSLDSYDVRLDIPARAYLNHQILRVAEQRNDIRRSKEEVFSSPPYLAQGLDATRYPLLDSPAHIVALLYCLVVVPKEILDYPEDHFMFKRLDQHNLKKCFHISDFPKGFERAPSYFLIRALRNSVAHVLYKFDDQIGMHFWTDREPRWKAHASVDGLSLFLSTFGSELANTLLLLKRRQIGSGGIGA